jgi:hypothetical protein
MSDVFIVEWFKHIMVRGHIWFQLGEWFKWILRVRV